MFHADSVRRGLRHFVGGRIASGVLGVLWLGLLVRVLDKPQLGVYYGVLSVFEIAQTLGSLGVLSYAQRFLPTAWVSESRLPFARTVRLLFAWRLLTLLLAAAVLMPLWSWATNQLGWPAAAPGFDLVAAFLVCEGCARFFDLMFESTVSQGVSQMLGVLRNAARIGVVYLAMANAAPIDAAWVFRLEVILALAYVALGCAWTARLIRQVPGDRPRVTVDQRRRLKFALQGYASLAIGGLIGGESVRLILSHLAGPSVLGVVGFALSLVDVMRRYMPANLFLGFVRAVLTGRAESGHSMTDTLFRIRLLMRVNAIFLIGCSAWLLVYGDSALRAFTNRDGLSEAAPYVAVLMGMLFVQSLRLMSTLVAHVQSDNLAVVYATAAIVVGPMLVFTTAPWIGGMGAVLALLAQEAAYSWVLVRRLRLRLTDLCGEMQGWLRMLGAGLAALTVGLGVQLAGDGGAFVVTGSVLFTVTFVAALLRWPPLQPQELSALKGAIRRRAATA